MPLRLHLVAAYLLFSQFLSKLLSKSQIFHRPDSLPSSSVPQFTKTFSEKSHQIQPYKGITLKSVPYTTPTPSWNIAPSETPEEACTFSSVSVQIRQNLPAGRLHARRPPLPAVLAGYYSHHKVQPQLCARIQPAPTCITVTVQHTPRSSCPSRRHPLQADVGTHHTIPSPSG